MKDVNYTRLMVTPGRKLYGEYHLPGDKSISHRAALLAALAHGESHVEHFLEANVTQAMLDCLAELGVEWELQGEHLWVLGKGLEGLREPNQPLDCGNSATTLRLLAGALSAAGISATLDGTPGLRRRPMQRILEPLGLMGVDTTAHNSCAPITLKSFRWPLKALDYELPVASAQVKSCLLLAGLACEGTIILTEPGPSRDHSERMLTEMGIKVQRRTVTLGGVVKHITSLAPPTPLTLAPLNYSIPGDFSSAAFLIVAALITPGSKIILGEVGLNPTRIGLLEVLWEMGADVTISNAYERHGEPVGDLTIRASALYGTQVSGSQVVRMIDEFPALAVAASFAEGPTLVRQADELRLKESDRIGQLCKELGALGVNVKEMPDGFTIQGGNEPAGGSVESHGDHRLAMAMALVGLASKSKVTVQGAEVIGESFPEFTLALQSLGADIEADK